MVTITDISEDPFSDERHLCEVRINEKVAGRFTHNGTDNLAAVLIHAALSLLIIDLNKQRKRRPMLRLVILLYDSLSRVVAKV